MASKAFLPQVAQLVATVIRMTVEIASEQAKVVTLGTSHVNNGGKIKNFPRCW